MLYIDMTELIKRGRARLIYEDEYEVCLKDKYSGAYFYAMDKKRDAALNCAIEAIKADAIKHSNTGKEHFFVLHQIEAVEPFGTKLLAQTFMECRQCVYTRREKVPVKGLYVTDSTRGLDAGSEKPVIRRLGVEYAKAVYDNYDLAESMEYIRERIEKGMIFGAFAKDKLAGFVGYHAEGSIGMLEVLPQFRRRGIGRALEVFIINHCIESGYTPYGNVVVGNEVSERLQESIGLYFSKTNIFWGSFNITGDKT
jgi:tRNA (guanine37-N1)-methyltransferase